MDTGGRPSPELQDASLGELLKQLSEQTSTLVRQEIDLAKAEVTQKGKQAGAGAGMLAAAGVVGLLALGAVTAMFIALLDTAMATWLAALIVTVVYGAIAGVLALVGRKRLKAATPVMPEQTVETVKEDVEWAKTQARSART
jgi:tetrahydromethanopterin S-methyltransferase subunit C